MDLNIGTLMVLRYHISVSILHCPERLHPWAWQCNNNIFPFEGRTWLQGTSSSCLFYQITSLLWFGIRLGVVPPSPPYCLPHCLPHCPHIVLTLSLHAAKGSTALHATLAVVSAPLLAPCSSPRSHPPY
jgi:hypothetical protein